MFRLNPCGQVSTARSTPSTASISTEELPHLPLALAGMCPSAWMRDSRRRTLPRMGEDSMLRCRSRNHALQDIPLGPLGDCMNAVRSRAPFATRPLQQVVVTLGPLLNSHGPDSRVVVRRIRSGVVRHPQRDDLTRHWPQALRSHTGGGGRRSGPAPRGVLPAPPRQQPIGARPTDFDEPEHDEGGDGHARLVCLQVRRADAERRPGMRRLPRRTTPPGSHGPSRPAALLVPDLGIIASLWVRYPGWTSVVAIRQALRPPLMRPGTPRPHGSGQRSGRRGR